MKDMNKNSKKLKLPGFFSIGIDVESTVRFSRKKLDSAFLKRIYTSNELAHCFNKSRPQESLAGRFAAKESVRKALSSLTKAPIDYKRIEIVNDVYGVPSISLKNEITKTVSLFLSISHTKDTAVAVTIAMLK